MDKWLDSALDYGISENDFWEMTIAELIRAIQSKKRVQLDQERRRAAFDYILADSIGRSVARLQSSANRFPPISEVYPSLFTAEEVEEKMQEKKNELSVLRFKQFAHSYNKRFEGGVKD